MVSPSDIEMWIKQGLDEAVVTVEGDGRHFEAKIVAVEFKGKNTLSRHRLVYEILGDRMREEIHALSLKTYTPDEQP